MSPTEVKQKIRDTLQSFKTGELLPNAKLLLNTLGYQSEKSVALTPNTPENFLDTFHGETAFNKERALLNDWVSVDLVFQLTDDELNLAKAQHSHKTYDLAIYQSYLFIAIELTDEPYSRTKLVGITREVNKLFAMPAMLMFKCGRRLTVAIINRRPGKRDFSKDVLEKVTLIKDINLENPHRAHIEILHELALPNLAKHKIANFLDLHNAWQKTLDISELNKKFYREIADWYFWAMSKVVFPDDAEKDPDIRNATSLIRLITRLIFVWFLKEKGLVPERVFDETEMNNLLNKADTTSTYYKAILQNLFFATLNTEMNRDKPGGRRFVNGQYMVHTFYRYQRYFQDRDAALTLFEDIPFLNGGLFECLDRKGDDGNEVRIDCFSENPKHETRLQVPDELFFGAEQTVDLSEVFGDKRRAREKVRGIIRILDSYKFTVAENTPLEEEVALDPELLGKVFENLLASYNPETKTTARKQTGSFYTPREIVNYMVDESLIAYLETKLVEYHGAQSTFGAVTPATQKDIFGKSQPQQTKLAQKKVKLTDQQKQEINERLRQLFAYTEEANPFSEADTDALIRAIDACKILDPACGSGAFPMGILHRMVYLLGKLDPDNRKWREVQKARAIQETEEAYNLGDREERKRRLAEIEETFDFNSSDYGRKLHLIENCIYGVDIQPIACQIAKLRFFISLVVEQEEHRSRPNLGIRPLPNLETRFVAANTLIGLEEAHGQLEDLEVKKLKAELKDVRHRHFTARTYTTKEKYRQKDKEIRERLKELLQDAMNPETAAKIAGWNPYDQNASADFFDMEWMFGLRDGFDVVIGNPPYISHDRITKEEKSYCKLHFKSFDSYADAYCYFLEKCLEIQRRKGYSCLITSNSYLRTDYGRPLRNLILEKTRICQIINIEDSQLFESAIVNTAITLLQNASQQAREKSTVVNASYDSSNSSMNFNEFVKNSRFLYDKQDFSNISWGLSRPEFVKVIRKIEGHHPRLRDLHTKIRLGLATGANDAFVIDASKKDYLVTADKNNTELIKPLLKGRDIDRYVCPAANHYIILAKNGRNVMDDYPILYKYFDSLGKRFKTRGAQGKHWTNLRACAFLDDFKKEKIIWIELSDRGRFALCSNEVYLLNTAYYMIPPAQTTPHYLLGILNSKVIQFYLENISEKSGMGVNRWFNIYVREFPIPLIEKQAQSSLAELAARMSVAKQQDPTADTDALENQIDLMVYKLYGLSHAEVKIVDPEFAMSEAGYEAFHLPS